MPDHTVSLRNHTSSPPSLYPVPYRYTYKPEHYRLLKQTCLRRDSNGLPLSSVLLVYNHTVITLVILQVVVIFLVRQRDISCIGQQEFLHPIFIDHIFRNSQS